MLLDAICIMSLMLINATLSLILPFYVLVGYSRVYLQKHNNYQVIFGFIAGVLIYLFVLGIYSYFF